MALGNVAAERSRRCDCGLRERRQPAVMAVKMAAAVPTKGLSLATTVGTAGNMTGAVTYNPGNGAKNPAVTGTALLTTTGSTGISTGTFFLYSSSSQGIQYGVQWSGVTGSPVYSVYGILE